MKAYRPLAPRTERIGSTSGANCDLFRIHQAAEGFTMLGMYVDAWNELEALPGKFRGEESVLSLRIKILQSFGRWQYARELAESLAKNFPANPRWWLSWACSLRWEQSVKAATLVLEEAVEIHPRVALIHYNLACLACAAGEFEKGRMYLQTAVGLDASLQNIAIRDADLQALPPVCPEEATRDC